MLIRRCRMLLAFGMSAGFVMMRGLKMMVRGSLMTGGGGMMVFS